MVRDLTLEELCRLDFGSYRGEEFIGARIPTLEEVLALVQGRVILNIELKNGPVYYAGIEESVAKAVHSRDMEHQVIVSSFDHPSVARIRTLLPKAATGLLFQHRPFSAKALVDGSLGLAMHPYYAYVTEDFMSECRQLGLAVNVWGTNDPAEWERLMKLGVNAIITDYPGELARLAGRLV
jgi:glycerophosphoryl diester phosphodiesterase